MTALCLRMVLSVEMIFGELFGVIMLVFKGLSWSAIWLLKTKASKSEFEARRLAPWTPV